MNILLVNGTVDNNDGLINALELERKFENIFKVFSVMDAKRIMKGIKLDVILFFLELPERSFMEIILAKEKLYYDPVIIVCSNRSNPKHLKKYDDIKFDLIYKPFSPRVLNSLLLEKTDMIKINQNTFQN